MSPPRVTPVVGAPMLSDVSPAPPSPSTAIRHRSDAGVTVIEMLVASFILGLGVMGVASLMVTGARTASVAETRADAAALANGEVEIIRSLDYELVGIEPGATGYVSEFDGRPTVTERVGNVVRPSDEVVIGSTTFGVTRSVTWATVGADREAYKIVTIVVEWTSRVGPHALNVQTGIHEGMNGG